MSYFTGAGMDYFKNPSFGIDSAGAFAGVGDSLASSPLSVGGASGGGGLFGGMGGLMMGLNAANSFMGGMQQGNLNQSAQAALDAQTAMFDAGFGRDVFAQNFDRFRSFNDPVIAAKIAVNTPAYRQSRTMQGLPELAGKYGRFGAFVS
jgi:hypothetical protein